MTDKQPMQADGQGGKVRHGDGVSEAPSGRSPAGESGGGAYPNPHHGKKPKNSPSDFMGHGGQGEIGYYGTGQLGGRKVDEQDSAKAEPGRKD